LAGITFLGERVVIIDPNAAVPVVGDVALEGCSKAVPRSVA